MKNKKQKRILIWGFFLGSLLVYFHPVSVHAQESRGYINRVRGAQYFLGEEGDLLIPVNIWGFVTRPGQYMIPANTDLVSLLSYAGGPTESAKISSIKIVRNDPETGNTVYPVNVKKYLETANEDLIPTLRPGDTIIVKGTTFHWISKFFDFISKLVVFAQFVYFIAIAQEYLRD
jgi:hypothetical protein